MRDLEDEIGVDLLRRSPRGLSLTPEGKFFLEEARELLKFSSESVKKVHAMVRGEYSELHIGYRIYMETLPRALAAFQKAGPGVKVLLHELPFDELMAGLRDAALALAVVLRPTRERVAGIEFESLHTYPMYVVLNAEHPLARLESIPVEKLTAEPIVGLHIDGYRSYLDRIFACTGLKPRMALECDTFGSALIEVEAGRGITFCAPIRKLADDKRVLYRRLTGTTEALSARIARAKKRHVTPAGEEFCDILRKVSNGATATEPDPQDFSSFPQSNFI
jgi:DNA-binding transcriptional LysR family regulator